ncbi:Haloacid dehalogenase-like hydrolase [Actinokineospora diospyrosa]|uniref:Haloacid dehalogenase-like hydrolase n=1 Tax=Actinokineospora diospyrosa TaxID=103728 RepID=A0ABT1I5J6_9PSEU|nr:Haloacid dehalogenase-like hydrolase [Actinokineospora diospyrosa]
MIFDCDGVLVDSEPIAIRANMAVGPDLGWPITEAEVINRFVGRSATSIAEVIADRLGRPAAAVWERRFHELHTAALATELTAVPGVSDVLDALDAAGVRYCVASSGTHEKMRGTLGGTGLYSRFVRRIFSMFCCPQRLRLSTGLGRSRGSVGLPR